MKYDNNKSLTENAMAGVDITEPDLPDEIDLAEADDFFVPDQMYHEINEYLADKYGFCVNGYGLELKVVSLDWDTED